MLCFQSWGDSHALDVSFATAELRQAYEALRVGKRLWGEKIATLYMQRVNTLHAVDGAPQLRELRHLRFHALKGGREGEYAIDLDVSWRLTMTFGNKGMTIVRVEEVSKHYGD
jgi:proteic killer suppression protein